MLTGYACWGCTLYLPSSFRERAIHSPQCCSKYSAVFLISSDQITELEDSFLPKVDLVREDITHNTFKEICFSQKGVRPKLTCGYISLGVPPSISATLLVFLILAIMKCRTYLLSTKNSEIFRRDSYEKKCIKK